MRITDYDSLIHLWKRAGLQHRPEGRDSRANVSKDLANANNLYLLAWEGETLIGSVLCTDDGRKGWINRLAVDPTRRRQGLARLLVNAAEEHFHRRTIEVLAITVYRDNAASLELFHSLGYEDHEEVIYLSKRTSPEA
jgi:ribosomal protein S18 acetylase RimI-like enzyme